MKKQILMRSLLGALLGISICHLITVAISCAIGGGSYIPVQPELSQSCGSERNAVLMQTGCAMLYGAIFAGASVIWNMERWSILRMTVTHWLIVSIPSCLIAWIMHWMSHNIQGVLIYIAIFFSIYAGIWFSQFSVMKNRVREMNRRLQQEKDVQEDSRK